MFSLAMKEELGKSELKEEVKDGYLVVQEKGAGATGTTGSGKKHRKKK